MLRLGLTGGMGSGKSTVARMLAARGAHTLSSDAIARELMQPGQPVFAAIVDHFGEHVLAEDGTLDRAALAHIVFDSAGPDGLTALNAIVHPAVIHHQEHLIEQIAASSPQAVVVVESALIFETQHGGPGGWHLRFDRILLVCAADELKIARYLNRMQKDAKPTPEQVAQLTAEARRRLAQQLPDAEKARNSDFILVNNGALGELERQVDVLWPTLQEQAGIS